MADGNSPAGGAANHTQSAIVDELRRAGGRLRIGELARALKVSEETVRRNLKRLAETGQVRKMHGAAELTSGDLVEQEDDFTSRLKLNPEAKRLIARHVARLIPDGASVFLDVGSTTAYIAEALRDHQGLVVVTNSAAVAHRLATRNDNRVFMAGGELRSHDGGAFGSEAIAFARNFQTDLAILSAAAIDARHGLMLFDLDEALFSRAIIANAGQRIVAADHSKFGRQAPITVCAPDLIDRIVTDRAPAPELADAIGDWGTALTVAHP